MPSPMSFVQRMSASIANKKKILSDVLRTVEEGGLTGAAHGSANIWKEPLDSALNQHMKTRLGRTYAVPNHMSQSHFDEIAKTMRTMEDAGVHYSDLSGLAQDLGLEKRHWLSRNIRELGGAAIDTPLGMVAGKKHQRLQALHDLWKGGLIGEGSTLRKSVTPGREFFQNADKYKNLLMNGGEMPGFREMAGDAYASAKAVGKPLLYSGALLPAYSIGKRISNPTDNTAEGVGRDLGWYAGLTLGVPFGLPAAALSSEGLKRLGGLFGSAIDPTINRMRRDNTIPQQDPTYSVNNVEPVLQHTPQFHG